MTQKLYKTLAARYKFSPLTFKVLYTGLATVCRYSSGKPERMSLPALVRTLRISFNVETDYIFQQNATGKSSMSMTICYDVIKKPTVALVFGARQDEANAFIDILLSRGRTPHWSALPLAALELTADDFSNQIKPHETLAAFMEIGPWATTLQVSLRFPLLRPFIFLLFPLSSTTLMPKLLRMNREEMRKRIARKDE